MNTKTLVIAAGICGLAASSQAQIYDPSLVGWYKFDEGAGATVAANSVTGSTNGAISLTGVTTGVGGVSGNAYQFTKASNGFVDMGNANFFSSINLTGQLTITTWINTNSTVASGNRNVALFAGDSTASNRWVDIGYSGPPDANGQAYGRNRPGNNDITEIFSGSTVGDDAWHHLALTIDVSGATGTLSFYLDGLLVNSATVSGVHNAFPPFNNFEVGRLGRSSPVDYFGGFLDDVQVYDSALTAGQVSWLFNNPGEALTVVPEPAEASLAIAAGLGLLAVVRRNRRHAVSVA